MAISKQIKTIKENWLIILGLFVIILIINSGADLVNISKSVGYGGATYNEEQGIVSSDYFGNNFEPEVTERIFVKTVSSSLEIKRGRFDSAIILLKNQISDAEGLVLNENINSIGEGITKRRIGYYSIRIPEDEYPSFISDVKTLGKVESFSENLEDITGAYISLSDTLELEKEKLERYEQLYKESSSLEDKLSLTDRIFQQERTIKYLEELIENKGQQIEYVTVTVSLNEKQSSLIGISFVTLGAILKNFINSLNKLILLVVWILPWALIILIGRIIWKAVKKK